MMRQNLLNSFRTRAMFPLLISIFVLFLAGTTQTVDAQSALPGRPLIVPPDPGAPRTITVIGEGIATGRPDVAQATIGVEIIRPTVQEATREAQSTMTAVLKALRDQGIAEKDIQTSGFSVWTDRGRPPEDQIAYRVSNGVSVIIRDLDKVGAVLDAAIEAGANNVYGVRFYIEDPSALESDARAKAMDNARARAEELAKLSGVQLGPIIRISEVIGGGVSGATMAAAPVPAPIPKGIGPIMPGEFTVSARLQVTFAIAGEAATRAESAPSVHAEGIPPAPSHETATVTIHKTPPPPPERQPGEPPEPSITVVGGEGDQLLAFVKRWLTPRYPGAPSPAEITLWVGKLPENLPFDLPLPEDVTVIGSLVRGEFGETQIFLDAQRSAQEIVDFYMQALQDQGFTKPAIPETPGMVFAPSQASPSPLCSPDKKFFIQISAFDIPNQPTDVRINIYSDRGFGPCQMPSPRRGLPSSVLPQLTQPANVTMHGSGGGGGDRSVYASADLKTKLSPAELAAHYRPQLEASGWELLEESQTDAVAWSTWAFTDEQDRKWRGMLLIAKLPTSSDSRYALLRADMLP